MGDWAPIPSPNLLRQDLLAPTHRELGMCQNLTGPFFGALRQIYDVCVDLNFSTCPTCAPQTDTFWLWHTHATLRNQTACLAGYQGTSTANIHERSRASESGCVDGLQILFGLPPAWARLQVPSVRTLTDLRDARKCQESISASGEGMVTAWDEMLH